MPANQAFLSVNAGELSPYLRHRTDFDQHGQGAELFENFIPLPFGGYRKRPGLEHVATLAAATRLEPFQYSEALAYLIGWTATGATIFGSDGTTKDTVALPSSPIADPFALQFAHINSLLWTASLSFHPQILTRVADNNWTLGDVPFSYPPFLDQNLDEALTLTLAPALAPGAWADATNYPLGTHVTHGGKQYTCTAAHLSAVGAAGNEPNVGKTWATVWRRRYLVAGDSALLTASAAGILTALSGSVTAVTPSLYRLRIERALDDFETEVKLIDTVPDAYSAPVVIQGGWSVISYGTWDGKVTLQLSFDDGVTWEDRRQWTSDKSRNFEGSGEESRRCLARLHWVWDSLVSTNKPRAVLTASSPYIEGIVEIQFFSVNYTVAVVTALTDCEFGETDLWTESAFSDRRGFPAAVGVHASRALFAGTPDFPVGLWGSASDDLVNFNTDDDLVTNASGFFRQLASTQQNPIRWLASHRRLMLGTAGAEWVAGNSDNDGFDTPDLTFTEYTFHGSASLPALRLKDSVIFVERQRRRVRELAFQLERESYSAADLTRLAEHITAGDIVQLAWQNNREPCLWVVTGSGLLLCFVYHREERIAAWSRHTTAGGAFRSVAVLRDESSGDDVVFVVVERSGTFHLEKFAPDQQATQEDLLAGEAPLHCFHVDSGVRDAATDGANQIDTPAHLDGIELHVLADGYFHRITPAAGKLTLPFASTVVQAGLPLTSRLILLPPEVLTDSGSTHAKVKRANKLHLSLYKSRGGQIIYPLDNPDDPEAARTIPTTDEDTPLNAPAPAVTGWFPVTIPGGHVEDLQFEVRHATPEPFTVAAMTVEWALTEQS